MRRALLVGWYAPSIFLLMLCHAFGQTTPDVAISFEATNQATATVNGIAPLSRNSQNDVSFSATGTERSQCSPSDYGRKSSAHVSASNTTSVPDASRVSATLRASAVTQGGHFRTCAACDPIAHNCIGIMGNDTRANASALSIVQAKLSFSNSLTQNAYDLRIGNSLPGIIKVSIVAPDGSRTTPAGGSARIAPNPGDTFYVEAQLAVAASNAGGCCEDGQSISGQFDLHVVKPPILATRASLEPFIAGGKETTAYENVVALTLSGELHCSGTVIAPKTILTAAHCINGYEERIAKGEMTYLIGSVITAPQKGPFPVTSGIYPRSGDEFRYNPGNYDHDIGLVFAAAPIPVKPAALHKPGSSPSWSDLVQKKRPLTFVGFGYNKSNDGQLVGLGVKREAPWPTNATDEWRFYFRADGKNTCKGDSGGPALLLDDENSLLVVGVTSEGDRACTFGDDTRVDAHFGWISTRLQ